MWKDVATLLKREVQTEFRQKVAIGGIGLFIVSTVFVCYLSFRQIVDVPIWNALFWIIILFTAFSAIGKSFIQESTGVDLYFYSIVSPQSVIVSKMIYNLILMLVIGTVGLAVYSLFIGKIVLMDADIAQFIVAMLLGSAGFAMSLTLISGIASKTNNNLGMMSILGFPIVLPLLVTLLKVSKNALDGLDWSVNTKYMMTLMALNVIVATLSYLLFPYLWRE